MRCTLITSTEDLEALESRWDSLLDRSAASCPFSTWAWVSCWWAVYGRERQLYTVLLEDDGALVGIAPLFRDGRRLRLLGSEAVGADYLDLILEKGHEDRALEALFDFLDGRDDWDVLELGDVDSASETLARVRRGSEGRRQRVIYSETTECPFARLAPTFDDFLGGLSSARRYDIRRKLRKIAKKGTVTFEMVDDAGDLDAAIAVFSELNRERLGNKRIEGGFLDGDFAQFHKRLMPELHRRSVLRLCLLKVDQTPIASLYIIRHGSSYLYYQGGFNSEWNSVSPGTVIFANAIRYGIENEGIVEFDFLRGDEGYKQGWTNDRRTLATIEVFRSTPRARVLWNWTRTRRAVRKSVKNAVGTISSSSGSNRRSS